MTEAFGQSPYEASAVYLCLSKDCGGKFIHESTMRATCVWCGHGMLSWTNHPLVIANASV